MEIVRIKVPSNIIYDVNNYGEIKAKRIMEVLYHQKEVTKKMDSVMESIENCLWDGKEIKKAQYDMLLDELVLTVSDLKWYKCPRCNKAYEGFPALSRRDNETEICPDCGQAEALEDWIDYNAIKEVK